MNELTNVRVLVVDDHPALAYGAKLWLDRNPRMQKVEVATSGADALDALERLNPHVVVLDLHLVDMDGLEVAQSIRRISDAHIVLYTGDENWIRHYDELIALGISGMVHKKYSIKHLEHAVECALNGYVSLPLEILSSLRPISHDGQSNDAVSFTDRETQILTFLERGFTNQEIATELYVSPKTVENYLTRIYRQLGVESRYDAVRKFRSL